MSSSSAASVFVGSVDGVAVAVEEVGAEVEAVGRADTSARAAAGSCVRS